jgi:hypothetical protein
MRTRTARPRFLTAIAVSAAVCEGLEERIASDMITPAYLVFEWLLVEAFVRVSDRESTKRTPGTLKAQTAKQAGEPMCARTYLRAPSIFGFHGVYKPLARHLGIVDDDLRLSDNGYALLKEWQNQQHLEGFFASSVTSGPGTSFRQLLRQAVEDGLRDGCSKRSATWQGWRLLADHLAPATIGQGEATLIHRLLLEPRGGTRGEVFQLLESASLADASEAQVVQKEFIPRASQELASRLRAIVEFETLCTLLEDAFDWIRYLSSTAGARAVTAQDFAAQAGTNQITSALQGALNRTEAAIVISPFSVQAEFTRLARAFQGVRTSADLFEAVLSHHHRVQQAKKPEGKRDWFERSDGSAFVRVPHRLLEPVQPRTWWGRPYRIDAARSFWSDLKAGLYEPAQR